MTPAELACRDQYRNRDTYPGIDNWQNSNLHHGNVIYIWEKDGQCGHGGGNAYSMTPNTAFACGGNPNKLQELLQTNLDPKYPDHRGHLQAYVMNTEIPAAFSHTQANTCHGVGGGEQYFIPNFDQQLAEGRISKIDDLNLDFNKAALPIDQDRIDLDKINTTYQKRTSSPSSPEPSPGTTPTLEGAYTNPTPHKADELKPNVNDIQKEWDKVGKAPTSENVTSINGGGSHAPPTENAEGRPRGGTHSVEDINTSKHTENAQKAVSDADNNLATNAAQNAQKTGSAFSGGVTP